MAGLSSRGIPLGNGARWQSAYDPVKIRNMKLTVNGEKRELADDHTVRDLVVVLGLGKAAVAIELNKQIVPRKRHESTALREGDAVEVVTLVGGG